MKNAPFMLVLLMFFTSAVQAEVFKCQSSAGKTVYQEQPCPPSTTQAIVTIEEMDPAQKAEAEKRLADWETDFAAREAAEKKAQQEKRLKMERLTRMESMNRHNAKVQQQNVLRRSYGRGSMNCRQSGTCPI